MSMNQQQPFLKFWGKFSKSFTKSPNQHNDRQQLAKHQNELSTSNSPSTNTKSMQFENGALKISSQICPLCNEKFDQFVPHLIHHNHINRQFLSKEFCSAFSLNQSQFISTSNQSSATIELTSSLLQTLIFYLNSQKLPLYFKQLYSCHRCLHKYDSIHLLFSHLNQCDFKTDPTEQEPQTQTNEPINYMLSDPNCSSKHSSYDSSLKKNQDDLGIKFVAENLSDSSCSSEILKLESENKKATNINTKSIIINNSEANNHIKVKSETDFGLNDHQTLASKEGSSKALTSSGIHIRRIHIPNNDETLIVKSSNSPFHQILLTPTKDCNVSIANVNHSNNKNGHSSPSKQALQSRSNKRLLRNLDKKPELKKIEMKSKTNRNKSNKSDSCSDTIVINSSSPNKKMFNKICGTMIKCLKCKFCKRSNFKNEQNLHAHYQNVHNFFPLQPQSELLLSRFTTSDMKKYFHFRCLSCMKMFENFTNLSQHRCKYYFRQLDIPKKHSDSKSMNMSKPIIANAPSTSSNKQESVPDYESESEFFKNVGLMRKNNSIYKCEHVKLKLQNIANKLRNDLPTPPPPPSSSSAPTNVSNHKTDSGVFVCVKPSQQQQSRGYKALENGGGSGNFVTRQQRNRTNNPRKVNLLKTNCSAKTTITPVVANIRSHSTTSTFGIQTRKTAKLANHHNHLTRHNNEDVIISLVTKLKPTSRLSLHNRMMKP